MKETQRKKLLWIAVKLFDKSVDKATWLETIGNIQDKYDVYFMTAWRDKPVEKIVGGHPIDYFPQFGRGVVQKISRMLMINAAIWRKIKRVAPDIVLVNCLDNISAVRFISKMAERNGFKVVLDVRTLPTNDNPEDTTWEKFGKVLTCASKYYHGITYITEEMRRYCINSYRLKDHHSAIWTSGVNPDNFYLCKFPQDDVPFRLIYHGGIISAARGLDRLIQAIDLVRDLDVHLTLISSLRESSTIEWIDRLNLHDRIDLMKTIPHEEVPAQINDCHAGILPFS